MKKVHIAYMSIADLYKLMKIQITAQIRRTYLVRGRYLQGFFHHAIIEGKHARCIFHIKIMDCERNGTLSATPRLAFGYRFVRMNVGSHQTISLSKKEQDVIWDFIPYESGHNKIQLILEGLDINRDVVLDEYGSHIPIGENAIYSKSFKVYSFIEYLLIWFAFMSTAGAIAEIINLIINLR